MASPKIIQYLQACSEAEVSKLLTFSSSPYHCEDEQVRCLLTYLLQYHPDLTGSAVEKATIWTAIFPKVPYEDKRLRYLFSDTCRLVEQFWLNERLAQDHRHQQNELTNIFSERGLDKAYARQMRKWKQELSDSTFIPPDTYYAHYERAAIAEKHFERQRQRRFDRSIETAATHLDRFYYFQQLTYACGMLERQKILQGDYQLPFSEDWLRHLSSRNFLGDTQIELYYAILQMQRHEDEVHFRALREQLARLGGRADVEVLRSAYLAAINYCLRQMRKGTAGFDAEALDLYVEGLEQQVLLDGDTLSPWTFNNVVKLALRLKRFDWINGFMSAYEAQLPEAFREDALHYNRAELYYATNALQEAQSALLQVSYSDLNYYLGARVLLAKIYYEVEEIEPLLSLLAAFMIFLKRNRNISNDIRQTCLNFCNILFKIVKRKPGTTDKIRQRIQSTPLLTERQWLLAQVSA